jgi:hypothetical protein
MACAPFNITSEFINKYNDNDYPNLLNVKTIKTILDRKGGRIECIQNVTIPSNIFVIGHSAFRGASALKQIIFEGNNVKKIGPYAFAGCVSLVTITIPDSVTTIGNDAFYECTKIMVTINNATLYAKIKEQAADYYLREDQIIDGSNPTGGGNKSKKSTKKKKYIKKKKMKSAKKKKMKSAKKKKMKSTRKKKKNNKTTRKSKKK